MPVKEAQEASHKIKKQSLFFLAFGLKYWLDKTSPLPHIGAFG
jgi:hypothetical protein